ncbi:hypothetical protein [Streptomyces mexicanus]
MTHEVRAVDVLRSVVVLWPATPASRAPARAPGTRLARFAP